MNNIEIRNQVMSMEAASKLRMIAEKNRREYRVHPTNKILVIIVDRERNRVFEGVRSVVLA